jgi:hypothetical protein
MNSKLLKQTIGLILLVLLVQCDPQPTVEHEQPTIEYKYTFDTFPDGTPITGDTGGTGDPPVPQWKSLQGDEFSEWGFLVDATPQSSCVAVRMNFCWSNNNYLALLDSATCVNNRRIEITFIEPVLEVTLVFSGASTNYKMEVYDENGGLLGSPVQMAELNEGEEAKLFTISFSSDSANIDHISFGAYLSQPFAIGIREIWYVR